MVDKIIAILEWTSKEKSSSLAEVKAERWTVGIQQAHTASMQSNSANRNILL